MRSIPDPPEVDVWLRSIRAFWSQHLDALATELARGKRERLTKDPSDQTMGTEPDSKEDTDARHRRPDQGDPP